MDPDEKHIMNEEARAELLVPQFISHYCENCCDPIEGEGVILTEYMKVGKFITKIDRRYCLDPDCIEYVINQRYKVRRADNDRKHMQQIRNVSEMTAELKHIN